MSLDAALARLRDMRRRARAVDAAVDAAVLAARLEGATWEQVGEALGMTKQGAHSHWGRADEDDEPGVLA